MRRRPPHQGPAPLTEAFARERAAGLRLALAARVAVITLVTAWTIQRFGLAKSGSFLGVAALFLSLGLAQSVAGRRAGRLGAALLGVFILADFALLSWVTVLGPLASAGPDWPGAMQFRLGSFTFVLVLLALGVLGYSPGLALWTGTCAAVTWAGGAVWIIARPDSYTVVDPEVLHALDRPGLRGLLLDPGYVSTVIVAQEVLSALIIAGILAVAVARARRLALREARAAAERANLARYLSPNLVDELAGDHGALTEVRAQEAAILFVDIVGFTRLAEHMSPVGVIGLLREFHERIASTVFAWDGTLNKYVGDGVMASFGTPRRGPRDASNALACAAAIVEVIDGWNQLRTARGDAPVRIGVGAHFGPVVLGDIGDARCVEFAVLGDTVNTASRLESATRSLGVAGIVSEALVRAARAEATDDPPLSLAPARPIRVRNREEPVAIRILARGPVALHDAVASAG